MAQILKPPTISCSVRHPTWSTASSGNQWRRCRLWTLHYSLDWKSSMAEKHKMNIPKLLMRLNDLWVDLDKSFTFNNIKNNNKSNLQVNTCTAWQKVLGLVLRFQEPSSCNTLECWAQRGQCGACRFAALPSRWRWTGPSEDLWSMAPWGIPPARQNSLPDDQAPTERSHVITHLPGGSWIYLWMRLFAGRYTPTADSCMSVEESLLCKTIQDMEQGFPD